MNNDLISRQAAIDAILEMNTENRVSWLDCALDTLDALPPAEPRWIPVTERLPDDDSACFVTVKYRDIRYTDIAHCFASKDSSVRDWVGANDDDVLAWMPLPEPWKGEADG